jgi:hypothetical protein
MMASAEFIIKVVLTSVFVLCYLATLYWSIRQQVKHFNSNRFLEMTYYLISFYLLSMH